MGLLTRLDQTLERWRGERAEASGGSTDWASVIPQLLGASLLAATLVLLVLRFTNMGSPSLVTFDVIKYANAQRAVASKFISDLHAADQAAPLLLEISKRARAVINEVAGPQTLVVLSQSVVQGQTRDITDEVLTRLGLPTDVPTADPSRLVLDIAPTLLGAGPRMQLPESDRPAHSSEERLP
jgi:hypothetical protein